MTEFQEDMIFKNVSDQDLVSIANVLGIKSEKVKICTEELRVFDPTSIRPDLILELDDKYQIIGFQSTKVDNKYSRRGHLYVSVFDNKKNGCKKVELIVLSTAEKSKKVQYKYNDINTFNYIVKSLDELDNETIIKEVEQKLKKNEIIDSDEIVQLSLVPLNKKSDDIESYIKKVVDMLSDYKKITNSQNNLAFGIMWLIIDKFVKDQFQRNLLCDLLGDRMSLIHEYGENKYDQGKEDGLEKGREEGIEKGREDIVVSLLKSGEKPEKLALSTDFSLDKILEIKNKHNI